VASSKLGRGDVPNLQIARKDALAKTRTMIAESDQQSEYRHDWSFEIADRANQHILTVAFSDISNSNLTSQRGRC
jgi:hypothetical protein